MEKTNSHIVKYLEKKKWTKIYCNRDDIVIYHFESNDDFFQIVLPLTENFSNYNRTMREVVQTIAASENKTIKQINDFLKRIETC